MWNYGYTIFEHTQLPFTSDRFIAKLKEGF